MFTNQQPENQTGAGANQRPQIDLLSHQTDQQQESSQNVFQKAQPQTPTVQLNNQQTDQRPDKISFHLKTSIFTRRVTIDVDKMALGLIKQLAIAFLNEIYFQPQYSANTYIGDYVKKHFNTNDNLNSLYERLVLRIYDPHHESFVPFYSVSDIEPESHISIEVAERFPQHLLNSQSVSSSTLSSSTTNLPTLAQQSQQVSTTITNPTGQLNTSLASSQLKISHEFKQESYLLPTYCASCTSLIKGVFRQGYTCSTCKKNFCSKCKLIAERSGESCLTSTTQQQSDSSNSFASTNSSNTDNVGSQSTTTSGNSNTTNGSSTSSNTNISNKLDVFQHLNMAKRKSASNLLHFNIANPFKSHHQNQNQQQQQQQVQSGSSAKEDKLKTRGSAGALESVLQQLGKHRDSRQTAANPIDSKDKLIDVNSSGNNLLVAQTTHLYSSHQNLYASEKEIEQAEKSRVATDELVTLQGSALSRSQLSNSARNSIQDLHSVSPKRDSANHSFYGIDWAQVNDESLCEVCNKMLKNHQQKQQPFMCKSCKLQVHDNCQKLILTDCLSRIAESSRAAAERESARDKSLVKSSNSNVSRDNIRLHRLAPSVKNIKRPDSTKPIIEGWLKHTTLADEQARKHYWRLDETDITLYENDTSKRYFKAIALSSITRVMSANSLPKRVREDILTTTAFIGNSNDLNNKGARSANTSPAKSPELLDQMKAIFAFEQTSGSMYLVQANSELEASKWRESLSAITTGATSPLVSPPEVSPLLPLSPTRQAPKGDSETGLAKAAKGEEREQVGSAKKSDLKEAQDLVKPQGESERRVMVQQPERQQAQRHQHYHHHPTNVASSAHHHRHHKTYTDPNRSRLYNRPRITIKLDPMSIPDHYIEGKYLIERDRVRGVGFEELGSGQFGKVFAAISELKAEDSTKGLWSGVPVAIKEISKARFDLRQQAKLKNEANILSRLDHPGVIILERVHDLPDKIYIVMEQLEDDMLEMIVSTEEKRLSERITKFLTYQILEALKYLHVQNIAHCDLKPENVLLVERRSQFPQIKLCDFGFAKIIEDNSFRSSLVGTPAYLAPEVVKGERYNRSVDLWSVGVIVYVSLSGEFPFNEGENIHDQISRATFMWPDQPWAKISTQAKNFINSLLKVNCEKRLSASRAQMDDWIQDYQLWCDLSELEVKVGRRWVTDDADFKRWSIYAKKHNLQLPRSAIQLHEDLMAE